MKLRTTIFISSFILQLIVMYMLGGYLQPEAYEYEQIAVNLLTKHTFVCQRLNTPYYSLVPPLYPLFYATIYFFTNYSKLAMLFAQIILTSLLCVVIYLIGENIFDKKAGIIGAVLCIIHPGLIILSTTKLHELSFVTFLFALLILIILRFKNKFTYPRIIIIGIFMGMCILTRATIVLFLPLLLFWLFRENILKSTKERMFKSFILIIIICAVILPWIVRNYYIHHKFVFMQTPTVDLWVGNNENASGGNFLKDGRTVLESMPKEFLDKIYESDELNQDRIFKEATYKFIKEHPYKFVFLFFRKLYYFWWFAPYFGTIYPHIYLIGYKIWYTIILIFGLFGIILALSSANSGIKDNTYLLLSLFSAISIMQSLFYVEGRHRWVVEPLFLIYAAYGFISIAERVSYKR